MKILVVQDHLRSGGTERQSVLLARGFARAGHDATLLTFRPGGALAGQLQDVTHRVLQPVDSRLDWWAPRLRQVARKFGPDVIVCMGRMANCYSGALQATLPATAVVATLRTGKRLPFLFRRSLRRVAHIVANSHEAKEVLGRDHQVPAERVSVIYNSLVFPPAGAPAGSRESLQARHGAAPETVVLLCVAMFRPEKNQRGLLEVVRELPPELPWQLWLAGEGPALPSCIEAVRAWGLTDRVRFLGWASDPKPLYEAGDIAVLTSRRESLSNFLIEAQAHGLPAVAFNALGVAEAFRPDESGLLVPMNEPALFREALARLVAQPELRTRMGTCGREYARTQFAPERQLQAYLDLFQQLHSRCAS